MHSCGQSDHLLDYLAAVPHLHSLNLGSGTSLQRARSKVGSAMQIDVIPDTALLTKGRPSEIEAWVEQTLRENAGGSLEIQLHLEAGMPRENARTIFDTLARYGHPTPAESLVERWHLSDR